jgi:hypothetical protein
MTINYDEIVDRVGDRYEQEQQEHDGYDGTADVSYNAAASVPVILGNQESQEDGDNESVIADGWRLTDAGNAERLVYLAKGRVRYRLNEEQVKNLTGVFIKNASSVHETPALLRHSPIPSGGGHRPMAALSSSLAECLTRSTNPAACAAPGPGCARA